MNMDEVYFCCLYGNNENEVIIRHIDRDPDYEAEMIALEGNFWNDHVLTQTPPPYTEDGELTLESVRRHFGPADENAPEIELSVPLASSLVRYTELQAEKSELNREVKRVENEMKRLQGRIDQLQWELDHADIVRLQENSGKAIDRVKQALSETYLELVKNKLAVNDTMGAWQLMFSTVGTNSELLQKTADKLATAYGNIAYTADKALGGKKYDNAREQLENISKQQLLIQEQIRQEQDKKKTDNDQIKEWEQKIEELGQQAVEIINEMVEDIIGGSSSDIAEQLSDAFFEAFQNGEDYAEAWGDKVNEIVADVLKRMLVSKFLEEPLGDIFDKYKKKWFKDGNFVGLDEVINSMGAFASDLNAVGEDFATIWENLPDSVKNMFTVTDEASREASQKGIATASQESVDELNGRATAIQGHTFSISENTKLLLGSVNLILQSVLNIERYSETTAEQISEVRLNVKEVRDTVNDIQLKGIKLK